MSAAAMGSGTLQVLATPALIAMMEHTAMQAIGSLTDGQTTVGIKMDMQHLRPTGIGCDVHVTARLIQTEGRKYTLQIQATDADGQLIGTATHERFLVDANKFMAKIKQQ